MRRCGVFVTYLLLSAAMAFAQSTETSSQANAAAPKTAPDNVIRGSFATVLVKGLDSKKLKDGDQVICQTGGPIRMRSFLIPTGSKVIGHVTQATARDKGDSDSTLGIVFDKIEISKGKEIAMKGTLQSVAPSIGDTGPNTGNGIGSSNMGKSGGAGGGMGGGSIADPGHPNPIAARNVAVPPTAPPNSTVGATANPIKPGSQPLLNSQSEGVLGYSYLSMDKNNVLTSTGKEVKLDNGTQMTVRAEIEVPVQ